MILEKQIAETLKEKGIEESEKVKAFMYAAFLPESMKFHYPQTARLEGKIYLHIADRKTWQEAYDWCRERNGDLASVGNLAVHSFLCKYLLNTKSQDAWLGGAKIGDKYYWSDGTPWSFTSWQKGRPFGHLRGTPQDRVAMKFFINGDWQDDSNGLPMQFFVQWTLY
ncbi:MAG: C-type lectin domain-containing protein [Planctomycetaceae bacterium]|nr:C-type lectin domain-containing protein [Planctomycetaceae bacterium]